MASPKGLGSNESIGSVAVSPEQLLCTRRHFEPFYGPYRSISSGAIDCLRQMESIMATDPLKGLVQIGRIESAANQEVYLT